MAGDIETLTEQYRALVKRIGTYPMSEAGRRAILLEIEAINQAERDRPIRPRGAGPGPRS